MLTFSTACCRPILQSEFRAPFLTTTKWANATSNDLSYSSRTAWRAWSRRKWSRSHWSGCLFVLSSTHFGSYCYMRPKMRGSIASSSRVGHPRILLAMACNPKWPGRTRARFPGQEWQDGPHICTWLFCIKFRTLLDFVIREKWLRGFISYVSVTELQKRWLPYAHFIFILSA